MQQVYPITQWVIKHYKHTEFLKDAYIFFHLNINLKCLLPACCHRYNSSQWMGGRPFWSQRYYALSAEEGQPDQHAYPEGSLLHQKTLCLHPQPGVYVEAGLG